MQLPNDGSSPAGKPVLSVGICLSVNKLELYSLLMFRGQTNTHKYTLNGRDVCGLSSRLQNSFTVYVVFTNP
jgi:hypothetical protein